MSLPRASLFIAFLLMTVTPGTAVAQSLPLPSSAGLELIAQTMAERLSDPVWQCSPKADQPCPCITLAEHEGSLVASDFMRHRETINAARIGVLTDDELLVVENVGITEHDDHLAITFDAFYWRQKLSTTEFAIHASRGAFDLRDGDPEWALHDPRWVADAVDEVSDTLTTCDEWNEWSPPAVDDASPHSATEISYRSGQWAIEGFAMDDFPSPLLPSQLEVNRASSGFLPPVIRATDQGVGMAAYYHLGDFPLSLAALFDSDAGAGLGLRYWSPEPIEESEGHRWRTLDLTAHSDLDGPTALALRGDASVGGAARHAAVSLDGLSPTHLDKSTANRSRLNRNAFFRDWSQQRGGAAMAGNDYDLIVGATANSRGEQEFSFRDNRSWEADIWSRYGTRIDLGMVGRADIRLSHREFRGTAAQSARITSATLRLDRVMGSLRRAFFRPSIQGQMSMAVVDEPSGALAGSQMTLTPMVDGGLNFVGTPGAAVHAIMPRVFFGRRGVAQGDLPTSPYTMGPSSDAGRSNDDFNFGGVSIAQRLDITDGVQVRFPVTVTAFDDGGADNWDTVTAGTAEFAAFGGPRAVVIGIDGHCIGSCDDHGVQGRLQVDWGRRLRTSHSLATGRLNRPAIFDHIRGGVPFGDLSRHVIEPDRSSRVMQRSKLRVRRQRWSGGFEVFAALDDLGRSGGQLMVDYSWPQLGWGLGVDVAALPHQRRWAASVGLSTSPAF